MCYIKCKLTERSFLCGKKQDDCLNRIWKMYKKVKDFVR